MYAVIKTGGKQYRVKAGDVLVVEKLDGQPGDAVSFDQVLMLGGGDGELQIGAPLIDGAAVSATLIETRKGEKIKVFKKIRRQGYRRTQGHRQFESVLRVTAVAGGGKEDKWDGTVDLTPKLLLDARARNLPDAIAKAEGARPAAQAQAKPVKAAPKKAAAPKAQAAPVAEAVVEEAPKAAPKAEAAAPKAAPKKAAAPKAKAAPKAEETAPKAAKPSAKKPAADKAKG